MEDHGDCHIWFEYSDATPLVFTFAVTIVSDGQPTPERYAVELDRAAVHGLVFDGLFGEVLYLGKTSVKVRESARHQTCFRLPARECDGDLTPMFIVSTEFVGRFLALTYEVVPRDVEAVRLAVSCDAFISEILGGAR
jgi:hypothetical protein